MKQFFVLLLVAAFAVPARAIDDSVTYVGGTVSSIKNGTIGRFDTGQAASLAFEHSGGRFSIPYEGIRSYEYKKEIARHLGVLPAIAVGLVRMRQHRHFITITYQDEGGGPQTMRFEVPKHMPETILSVLETKAPQANANKPGRYRSKF
jgi:hypothetical protein